MLLCMSCAVLQWMSCAVLPVYIVCDVTVDGVCDAAVDSVCGVALDWRVGCGMWQWCQWMCHERRCHFTLVFGCVPHCDRDVHRLYELLVRDESEGSGRLSEDVEALRQRSVDLANVLDAVSVKLVATDKAVVDTVTAALPAGTPAPRITVLNKQVQ